MWSIGDRSAAIVIVIRGLFFLLLQRHYGERVPLQGPGVLSAPQTAEHQEPGEMVHDLEGQAQVKAWHGAECHCVDSLSGSQSSVF